MSELVLISAQNRPLRPLAEGALFNTGHHKDLNLPTYPHHKHDGHEDFLRKKYQELKNRLNALRASDLTGS
jgi:hypothetical protein